MGKWLWIFYLFHNIIGNKLSSYNAFLSSGQMAAELLKNSSWMSNGNFANKAACLDVLWGQPMQLVQVASNSELRENPWNDLLFFEIVPSHCFGPQKPQKLTASKIKYESFGPKFLIPLRKMDILVP